MWYNGVTMATYTRNTSGLIPWLPGQSGNPNTPPLTHDELQMFLDLIAGAHSASYAAEQVGRRRDTFWDHRRRDPAFAEAWEKAIEARGDVYEDLLQRKACGKADGDTVAIIVGLKMTKRFIEHPGPAVAINVALGERPFQEYTVSQLRAQLDAIEVQPAIEAEVKALPEPAKKPRYRPRT